MVTFKNVKIEKYNAAVVFEETNQYFTEMLITLAT